MKIDLTVNTVVNYRTSWKDASGTDYGPAGALRRHCEPAGHARRDPSGRQARTLGLDRLHAARHSYAHRAHRGRTLRVLGRRRVGLDRRSAAPGQPIRGAICQHALGQLHGPRRDLPGLSPFGINAAIPVLTLAEARNATRAQLLQAAIVGYELGARVASGIAQATYFEGGRVVGGYSCTAWRRHQYSHQRALPSS
ncbi:hypothetical protein J2R96_002056 [Bradyrhizobium elkanii]|nr:hypothetical protein [Bradyrhizobium elkanii]